MKSKLTRWTMLRGASVLVAATILAQGNAAARQENSARQEDDTSSPVQAALAVQVTILQTQYQELKVQLERAQAERQTIASRQYERDITPDSFEEMARKLPGQRIELMIDLAGLDARREALLAERDRQEAYPESEELVQLLERQVELLEENRKDLELLHERGGVSRAELRDAEHRALQAQIELLTVVASRSGGGPEAASELRQVSLDRADRAARLNMVESLMEQSRELRDDWQRLTRLRDQEAVLQSRLDTIEAQLMEARARLEAQAQGEQENQNDDDQ